MIGRRVYVTAALIALLAGWLIVLLFSGPARADTFPVQAGEWGPITCKAKYLLSRDRMRAPRRGHVVNTLPGRHTRKRACPFTSVTARATRRAYYKLGWPQPYVNSRASLRYGPVLHRVLQGKEARPASYVRNAARRVKLQADRTPAAWATRMVALAHRMCCGFRETWGRNSGPVIHPMQAITHRTFGLAWCVSFVQWLRVSTGLPAIADRTAGVAYMTEYARRRGWLRARPEPGYLAAWGSQHTSMVVSVTRSGYWTVGGNESDGIRHRFHPTWQRPTAVFIRADASAR